MGAGLWLGEGAVCAVMACWTRLVMAFWAAHVKLQPSKLHLTSSDMVYLWWTLGDVSGVTKVSSSESESPMTMGSLDDMKKDSLMHAMSSIKHGNETWLISTTNMVNQYNDNKYKGPDRVTTIKK